MRHIPRTPAQLGLIATRVLLPLALLIVGVALMVAGKFDSKTSTTAGVGIVLAGIGVMVWMLNWMFRMSVDSNHEREREEAAREYFARHGRWPDEERSSTDQSTGSAAGADLPEGDR